MPVFQKEMKLLPMPLLGLEYVVMRFIGSDDIGQFPFSLDVQHIRRLDVAVQKSGFVQVSKSIQQHADNFERLFNGNSASAFVFVG